MAIQVDEVVKETRGPVAGGGPSRPHGGRKEGGKGGRGGEGITWSILHNSFPCKHVLTCRIVGNNGN